MSILKKDFYDRNTLEVARELLGCKLNRKLNGKVYSGIIVETEAYTQDDPACHAYRGKTPRSATLFGKPGLAYVYFIYGMYHCLNFVTEPEDVAGAVLIRALEPIPPLSNTNGPGKLCRELKIDRELNEVDVTTLKSGLWVEKYFEIAPDKIVTTGRIGIRVATDYPWRFYIKENPFISNGKPLDKN
ncbi:MAG: DNA-3-methyladenine glycosylase [Candidatus Gastranaerophilales bacterium]|jgi:DNA-3-methyladenine glycosylase|nr:DNA-3-methyladenine glycosylase [Candidatus Gastranaerophilales bacterium]